MARRSVRKRRHTPRQRFLDGCVGLAELYDRADRALLAQAAAYEELFMKTGEAVLRAAAADAPDCVNFVTLWREAYSAGPDVKPSGTMTVVSVDRDAGTFTSD